MEESKTVHVTPPITPTKATPSQPTSPEQTMSLSSPELLQELKQPHTLKHVSAHTGLKTVFRGRGRPNHEAESLSKLH
ncbi:hypothetical protein R3I94_017606 [Phoxinus phoxinus]